MFIADEGEEGVQEYRFGLVCPHVQCLQVGVLDCHDYDLQFSTDIVH